MSLVHQRYDLVTPERSVPSSPTLAPAQINHEHANRLSTSSVDVTELTKLLQKTMSSTNVGFGGAGRPRPRSQLVLTSKPPSPASSTTSSSTPLHPPPSPPLDKPKKRPPLAHRPATCATPAQFIFKKPEYDQHYHDTHFHHHRPSSPSPQNNQKDLGMIWSDLRRFFVWEPENQKESPYFANQFRQHLGARYGTWGRYIGKGAGGCVRLIRRSTDQKTFAVKQFRKRLANESEKDYVKKVTAEFCIGSTLRHPNIIETLDIVQEDSTFYQIMEYAPTDLFNVVMSGMMSREEIACCWHQLLDGVSYMHRMGIAHRDLKLDNLVISSFGILKIIDFGCSIVFRSPFGNEKEVAMSRGVFGSDPYIAPEQHTQPSYDPRLSDVWSCAIIYICMMIRRFPWRHSRVSDPSFQHFASQPLPSFRLLKLLPRESRPIIASMLECQPKRRATLDRVLDDNWVKQIDVCRAEKPGEKHVHHVLALPPPSPSTSSSQQQRPASPLPTPHTSHSLDTTLDHLVILTREPPGTVAEKEKRKRAAQQQLHQQQHTAQAAKPPPPPPPPPPSPPRDLPPTQCKKLE
ncbi:kinase-like domain-containing protein [Gongronella butleri]|nr:kinase-like domain-containing protein [Gongronella butleri]